MAHYQSEYGRDKTTDEFGNPIRRTEDPVHHGVTEAATGYGTHDNTRTGYGTHDTTGTGYGTHSTTGTGYGTHGTATGPTGFDATTAGVHNIPLHRSDSSSSSEDDGYGGRRKKKGLEKIKEKLPGGTHRPEDRYGATTTPYGGQHQEKGMMDKIKEKLPGHH